MLKSCETLITKINEWQKAILELEKLSDEFLNTGDEKLKSEIENKKQKIISLEKEYQELAYPEMPNGENLFWPEKEFAETISNPLRYPGGRFDSNSIFQYRRMNRHIKIKNNHLKEIFGAFYKDEPRIDISFLRNLKSFTVFSGSQLTILPKFPKSMENIDIHLSGNIKLEISGLEELTKLEELKCFRVVNYHLATIPKFPQSIKEIKIHECEVLFEKNSFVYLDNLKLISIIGCGLKRLPDFSNSIEKIVVSENRDIEIPSDLTRYAHLKEIFLRDCKLKKLPHLPTSIEVINIQGNDFSRTKIKEIKKNYPNAIIVE